MTNQTLASEIITDQEKRLDRIIMSLDSIDILMDKGKFALSELMELTSIRPDNMQEVHSFAAANQQRMDMFIYIAFDYLHQAQHKLKEIIAKEENNESEKGGSL